MSEILAVESTGKGKPTSITSAEGGDIVSHCFEIRTANVDYFIGKRYNIFCVPFHIFIKKLTGRAQLIEYVFWYIYFS